MKYIKSIFHLLLSLFLAFQSVNLFVRSIENQHQLSIFESIFFAVFMNLVGTGMFAFVGFSFPTSKLLPTSYYKITNKRLVTKIYDFWGVKYFRFFLLLTFWKSKEKQKTFFNGTKEGLRQFTFSSNQAEFGHLGAFIFIQIYGIAMFLKGEFLVFMILSIINIIFNLYPIILQRKHRVRIQGILER